ncbi:hypothetical protein AAC387_Pa04g2293 [Persea americana]
MDTTFSNCMTLWSSSVGSLLLPLPVFCPSQCMVHTGSSMSLVLLPLRFWHSSEMRTWSGAISCRSFAIGKASSSRIKGVLLLGVSWMARLIRPLCRPKRVPVMQVSPWILIAASLCAHCWKLEPWAKDGEWPEDVSEEFSRFHWWFLFKRLYKRC